ncbi:putative transcriptional regulator [Methanomicrobium sp. W14]|uniref:winged helix-turn-helix transcriptional regulator n=1 Tax=Methanomicrobium sp. W14 TaxID=2817839 RepID=UPI001AE52EF3|nr:winged helix-turn-helix transcriptional regulator [Methanomicrobium sp. W14]MBP2132377.1 putative transcriptional regulator [Methanomicrobium sp. W14]
MDSDGADSTITFWELPLKIQVFYIAGLCTAAFGIFKILPFVFGKIKGNHENGTINNIYQYILKNPGSNLTEISKNLGLNRGTAKYYIHRLCSDNKIVLFKNGKFTRLFVNSNTYSENEKTIASIARNETNRMLLKNILDNPGTTNGEISDKFNMSRSTVHWYLDRFQRFDIATSLTDGRYKKWSINPDIKEELAEFLKNENS